MEKKGARADVDVWHGNRIGDISKRPYLKTLPKVGEFTENRKGDGKKAHCG